MSIRKMPGKTSLAQLVGIARAGWDGSSPLPREAPVMLTHHGLDGMCYDLLWKPVPSARRLFVFFSGDALRDKNDPPVFQRWSWANLFPGHCLFISDPSLYLDPRLGLAWYAGTLNADPMQIIADLITQIATQCGIPPHEVYSYGSSGGGFAALRLLTFLPDAAAIAINPQTDINAYKSGSIYQYYKICFCGLNKSQMMEQFPNKISLLAAIDRLRGKRIVIAQNTQDQHHLDDHFKPFCAAISVPADHAPGDPRLRRILFNLSGGHTKAEDIATFQQILALVEVGI